jgi:hypothetical protein
VIELGSPGLGCANHAPNHPGPPCHGVDGAADALVPIIVVLVPTIIVILVLLARRPVEARADEPQQLTAVT